MKMTTDPIGLYVHIPFCVKKCAYCDFCSFPVCDIKNRAEYIDALCCELLSYKYKTVSVDSIFFGGGTPSLLSGDEFRKITDAINESFVISDNVEFTVECNPKTLTKENLDVYLGSGVNRISIGLQSIHEKELKKLGRIHSYEDFKKIYAMVRDSGIKNVSVDLMYGIPEQNEESFMETLKNIVSLSPEHISVYGLIVEDGTYLSDHIDNYILPSEDSECNMYDSACNFLRESGYFHYEISNYSKSGYECRHNLKYWRDREYIGVGVSAYSYFEGVRFGNSRDYSAYVRDYTICREFEEKISHEGEKYEYAMLALRLSEGFSLREYREKFSCDFLDKKSNLVEKMSNLGLLKIEDDRIMLTEKGFYVSNSILSELL